MFLLTVREKKMYNRDEGSKRTRWILLDIAIFWSPDNLWWLFPFLFLTLSHSHGHFLLPCSIVNDVQVVMEVFCVAKSKTMRKPSSQHCQQPAYIQKITSKRLLYFFFVAPSLETFRIYKYPVCSWKLCNAFQWHFNYGNGYMMDCYVYVSPLLLLLWTSVWPSKFAFYKNFSDLYFFSPSFLLNFCFWRYCLIRTSLFMLFICLFLRNCAYVIMPWLCGKARLYRFFVLTYRFCYMLISSDSDCACCTATTTAAVFIIRKRNVSQHLDSLAVCVIENPLFGGG